MLYLLYSMLIIYYFHYSDCILGVTVVQWVAPHSFEFMGSTWSLGWWVEVLYMCFLCPGGFSSWFSSILTTTYRYCTWIGYSKFPLLWMYIECMGTVPCDRLPSHFWCIPTSCRVFHIYQDYDQDKTVTDDEWMKWMSITISGVCPIHYIHGISIKGCIPFTFQYAIVLLGQFFFVSFIFCREYESYLQCVCFLKSSSEWVLVQSPCTVN